MSIIRNFANSVTQDAGVRSAFFAFVLTRAVVLGVVILASNAQPEGKGPALGAPVEEVKIYLQQHGLIGRLGNAVTAADAFWYLDIARNGYDKQAFSVDRQHNWAFFPLLPLIIRVFAMVTREFPVTATFLSNIFFFVSLIVLHKTALLFGGDSGDADRAVFYLAAFPTAYFFSFPFTESLFLLVTILSFYFAKQDKWGRAGLFGALASATRLAGVFLLPALLILYWERHRTRMRPHVLALGLIPAGLIAFMIYLRSITGNPFAFFDIQAAWGHQATFFLRPLWDYVRDPFLLGIHWDFRVLNFASVMLGLVAGGVLLKKRQWAPAIYVLISLIVPLSANFSLQSLTRYVMVVFPVFLVLGTAGRQRRFDQAVRALFIALLAVLTGMFVLRVAMAMG